LSLVRYFVLDVPRHRARPRSHVRPSYRDL